jgi:hypothetical protein
MFYDDVFSSLNKNKANYLVVGGLAVNLYGFARATLDLDLLISLDQKNKDKFYRIMQELKFKTKKPALARKLMLGAIKPTKTKVVTFYRNEFELVDVFIQNPIDFDKAYNDRKVFKAGKLSIPTISYEMLIKMKQASGRDRDLLDIGYLKKIRDNNR